MTALPWVYDDGGRKEAGFKGNTGDCVTRALAIATNAILAQVGSPEPAGAVYQETYDMVNEVGQTERPRYYRYGKRAGKTVGRSSARTGVHKPTTRALLTRLGWTWHPTMAIGSGCVVHLAVGELPEDQVIMASVSKHLCTIINGVIHDNGDPTRDGTRCVYGYWTK